MFVEYFGWYDSDDTVFIAMEHIEHGDLDSHFKQPLAEAEAREITAQILEGLEILHENQFAHRDPQTRSKNNLYGSTMSIVLTTAPSRTYSWSDQHQTGGSR